MKFTITTCALTATMSVFACADLAGRFTSCYLTNVTEDADLDYPVESITLSIPSEGKLSITKRYARSAYESQDLVTDGTPQDDGAGVISTAVCAETGLTVTTQVEEDTGSFKVDETFARQGAQLLYSETVTYADGDVAKTTAICQGQ